MNTNLDDPKLTAYALDELSGAEKAAMESAVATSPEAQQFVRQVRELSGALQTEYETEREAHPVAHTNVVPMFQKDEPWSISRRLALAASIALLALVGAIAVGTYKLGSLHEAPSPRQAYVASDSDIPAEAQLEEPAPPLPSEKVSSQPDFNTARYGYFAENRFFAALADPLSTFSIDVDTASYSNIRRFIERGELPPKDAVRIEEMINYFTYDYPQPNDDAPFSVNLDAASCPWQPSHRLVRIGLKGRELPNELLRLR